MKQIGELSNGNLAIEMTAAEWLAILCNVELACSLPTICKDYRKVFGISRAALARKAGISRNYLARIEKGQANVSLRIYLKLLAVTTAAETEVELEG